MKRYLFSLLLVLFVLPPVSARAEEEGPAAMILYEPRTGTVLEALRPDEPMLIASTTKIMTALVVLERCPLHAAVEITQAQADTEGSSASLRPGETYTVEELLYGLMLASGNDAASALAAYAAGSEADFAVLMNEKAAALGLENTHFVNPHGLNDPEHFSTARDLALLTAAAMENPAFCRIFAARTYSTHGVEYRNHNKLLESLDGCIGGKTGYTRAAGRTLVSCAERDGLRLICVTLSDPDDWADHTAAYEHAFSAFSYLALPAESWLKLPVISGTAASVELTCGVPGVLVHRGAAVEVRVELPRFLFAPVAAGQRVGSVTVLENGRQLCAAEIVSRFSAALDENERLSPWMRFQRIWDSRRTGALRMDEILI